tara:strand:+ start:229 stop:1158 length:930 start_codon:yes stop_codon:yes gene_type:complete
MKIIILLLFSLILNSILSEEKEVFIHDLQGVLPWTSENFDVSEDKFTFAIFSDLAGGEREGVFEVAVEQLNLLRPEFVISVGDLIDDTQYKSNVNKKWESFNSRAQKINAPIFYVGGNNDLSNRVMKETWEEKYGPTYYHFVYKNILFLIMDTEDYPKGINNPSSYSREFLISGDISDEQKNYFLKAINQNKNVSWTFVFLHKPIWLKSKELKFLEIERALRNQPYTVFNGHLHTYSYDKRNNRDYIMLGTTGGRQWSKESTSFDHLTLVTIDKKEPSIVNLKLDGILNKQGDIPKNEQDLCFHAFECE